MISSISIRLATPDDAAGILKVYRPYILNTNTTFELEVPDIHEMKKRIQAYSGHAPWLVAVTEKKIIGYAYASKHRGRPAYQWSIEVSTYINEKFHGIGVGKRLYACLLEILKAQNFCTVIAGITEPNEPSNALHRSMGFKLIGTYTNIGYKMKEWCDVSWMSLSLMDKSTTQPQAIIEMNQMIASGAVNSIIKKHNKL